jgi:molecular chaperone GrpE
VADEPEVNGTSWPEDAPLAGEELRQDDEATAGQPAAPGDVTDEHDPRAGQPTERELNGDLEAAADAMEVDLHALLSEREEYLEAYRRVQADFENYRKQVQKRLDDSVERQLGGFVERLLPVLDACDAAAAQGASDSVEPIMAALFGALEKEGLERIDPKGEAFDPEIAEAVLHEPGDGDTHMVTEVLRPGYRWRGRLLRPALVKVTD